MKALKYMALGLLTVAGLNSCSSDYLETESRETLSATAAAEAAGHNPDAFLNGMWSHFVDMYNSQHDAFNYMATMLACDLMSEDIALGAAHHFQWDYQMDNRMATYRRVNVAWSTFYTAISKANEVIELYPGTELNNEQKALLGQAKAVRGMSYYYLIQIFRNPINADGSLKLSDSDKGLPIMMTATEVPDAEQRTKLKGANTIKAVLDQADSDLSEAVKLLEESGYERPSKNNIDATVANGLLARFCLLTQQWERAEIAAKKAYKGYPLMDKAGLHDGFYDLKNEEWMWGFDHSTETSTVYASFFSHISNLCPGYAGLGYSPKLIDARLYSQIPDDDYRKGLFNGPDGDKTQKTAAAQLPYANVKFGDDGNWTMDYMYMRAAEMYLIEAEALVRQGKNTEAATALKPLMAKRQPSWNKTSVTLADVLLQRRIELWGEGFAFFDLKRNNKGIDRTYSGNNHLAGELNQLKVEAQDVRWTYQIPQTEMQENDQLTSADQNP